MCSTYTFALGQFYQNESPTSCNPEVYYHIIRQVVLNRMTQTVAHSFSWQFTDNKADIGPDLGGEVPASGPGEEDPAYEEVGALLVQATFQD